MLDANAELVMSQDADLFYFKTTTSGRLLLCGEGIIRAGFVGSEASGVSSSAAVVRFEGTSNVRSFGVEGSLRISKGTMGAFKYGFHLTDVQAPKIIGLHMDGYQQKGEQVGEGANKQVISSQADSLIKISRIWADFFPANTSNQPI